MRALICHSRAWVLSVRPRESGDPALDSRRKSALADLRTLCSRHRVNPMSARGNERSNVLNSCHETIDLPPRPTAQTRIGGAQAFRQPAVARHRRPVRPHHQYPEWPALDHRRHGGAARPLFRQQRAVLARLAEAVRHRGGRAGEGPRDRQAGAAGGCCVRSVSQSIKCTVTVIPLLAAHEGDAPFRLAVGDPRESEAMGIYGKARSGLGEVVEL